MFKRVLKGIDDTAFASAIFVPYLFGTTAHLDPSGRYNVFAGGFSSFGFALGPVVAGHLISINESGMILALLGLTCFVVSIGLACPVTLQIDKKSKSAIST